jgi:hypothetical protein
MRLRWTSRSSFRRREARRRRPWEGAAVLEKNSEGRLVKAVNDVLTYLHTDLLKAFKRIRRLRWPEEKVRAA